MFKSDWVKLKQQIEDNYFDCASINSDHYLSFVVSMVDGGILQLYYITRVQLHRKGGVM